MTDLEINTALAKVMGWDALDKEKDDFRVYDAHHYGGTWRKFDYHDPVIFVAICKRWELQCYFCKGEQHVRVVKTPYSERFYDNASIEKAAALCVIDVVKQSVK